jgi:chromosome segregation ATPase
VKALESKLTEHESDMDVVLKEHAKDSETLQKKMEDLQDQVVNVNIELLQKHQTIESLVADNNSTQNEMERSQLAEIGTLRERLETLTNVNNDLEADASKQTELIGSLHRTVGSINADVSNLKAQLADDEVAHQVKLDEMRQAQSFLERELSTLNANNEELHVARNTLNDKFAGMETASEALLEDLTQRDGQLAQLRDQLLVLEQRNVQMQAEFENEVQEQAKLYHDELERVSQAHESLRLEIHQRNLEWQETLTATIESHEAGVNSLVSEKQALEHKILDMVFDLIL